VLYSRIVRRETAQAGDSRRVLYPGMTAERGGARARGGRHVWAEMFII
jgi:hypothetical protein